MVETVIIPKILDTAIGLRVDEELEQQGLDLSQHGDFGIASESISA
jgi:ammonia channel protein AmtB